MKSAIPLLSIILISCSTLKTTKSLGSLYTSNHSQDHLKRIELTHQPVSILTKTITDSISGKKLHKKLSPYLQNQYDSLMFGDTYVIIQLEEEYKVVETMNRKENEELLLFLSNNTPIRMVTSIQYLIPEKDKAKIKETEPYFLDIDLNKSKYTLYNNISDTLTLYAPHILWSNSEYLCMMKNYGKHKVISLEDKKGKCIKTNNVLDKYSF